ncbi:MAG: hypothetical protein PHC75_03340 [Burkholderiales bacterium]|nr:hypothetical protein [Burkholderiales bacterium]
MSNMPSRYSVEEYEQLIRKNGNKVYYAHWDLFDFVYGGKKALVIKSKYQEHYQDTSEQEIELEKAKIKQAIDNRVARGWLQLSESV